MSRLNEAEEREAVGERPTDLVAYVMTAGLASDDYRFLGRAPKDTFWRRYSDMTSFERPTAIVLTRNEAFRAYLSGILSTRKDRTKTPLRYSLVLEGPCRTAAAEALFRAVSAFVGDLGDPGASSLKVGSLGRALDIAFPEPFVESALGSMRDGGDPQNPPLAEIPNRLLQALSSLAEPDGVERTDWRFFSGGRASAAARSRFLGFAERLLSEGEPGAALAVNLASRDNLPSLEHGEPSCAVLFAGESGEDAFAEPLEQPPKKGRPGSPKGLPRAIVRAREAQAEPGFSLPRLGHLLWGALRTFRNWLLGTRESS